MEILPDEKLVAATNAALEKLAIPLRVERKETDKWTVGGKFSILRSAGEYEVREHAGTGFIIHGSYENLLDAFRIVLFACTSEVLEGCVEMQLQKANLS